MITFIYPEGDWTAAEIAIKIQALASSQGHQVYSPPKVGRRDQQSIARKLSQSKYAIFVAFDETAIDDATQWELRTLSDTNATIYAVVPEPMQHPFEDLALHSHPYYYTPGDIDQFITTANMIMDEIRTQGRTNGGELLVLLLLFGMLVLFVALLFEK